MTASTSEIIGGIDLLSPTNVEGWACLGRDPTRRLIVQVHACGQVVAQAQADKYRVDLSESKVGDGQCAFSIGLPDDVAVDTLSVYAWDPQTDTRAKLAGTGRITIDRITVRGEPPRLGSTSTRATQELLAAVGGNTGNLAFAYGTSLLLGFPTHTTNGRAPEATEELGVYTLANQLGDHFDPSGLCRFLAAAPPNWKVLGIGLGAQGPLNTLEADPTDVSLHACHREWLERIAERAPTQNPSIGVRGEFTLEVLERLGLGSHAVVTGCPSMLISPERRLGHEIASKYSLLGESPVVDTALGNPWNSVHAPFEHRLLQISASSGGSTHVQMAERHVRLANGDLISDEELDAIQAELCPTLAPDAFVAFSRQHLQVWWDVPAWMQALGRAEFFVGSRIHGVVLALQAGTPALCVAWDTRTLELCKTLGVPFVSLYEEPWLSGNFSLNDLRNAFESLFDSSGFDRRRRSLAHTVNSFFSKHGVPVSAHLKRLVE